MIEGAAATTAGGRRPEDVRDLVSRVGHGQFDLVIMNPPFTRASGQEGVTEGVGNPAFAAFEMSYVDQQRLAARLKRLSRGSSSNDVAGLASHFVELAHRKLGKDGVMSFVLPLSAASGGRWDKIRALWRNGYDDIVIVTISAPGTHERSFSADTGMAECLVVAQRERMQLTPTATFVMVNQQPESANKAVLLADAIALARQDLQANEGTIATLSIGDDHCGYVVQAALEDDLPWPHVGVEDVSLIGVCETLKRGRLADLQTGARTAISIVPISAIGASGPVHRLVGSLTSSKPEGVFAVHLPPMVPAPAYSMLWAHDMTKERRLVVEIDSEGKVRGGKEKDAPNVWDTATRAHYNRDLQFNAQSITVAMTERKCIGGRAWPSVILHDPSHEFAFSLWCNSTLGLLLHWWVSNKTQAGRGTTTVTAIPNIPTLDTRALSDAQHAEAKRQFDLLRDERFLPFDQIDEDPARAKLDRAILVNVLGLPDSLVAPDGPIDLIRRKLAREPQIHGGKKSRVVFTDHGETSVKRPDRG